MLDVHPPHTPTHTWRDFFIHIATITVGLLIAISLEQTVEAIDHAEQRRTLIEALREECQANVETLEKVGESQEARLVYLRSNLELLRVAQPEGGAVIVQLAPRAMRTPGAHSPSRSVWAAAKASGRVALLPENLTQVYDRVDFEGNQFDSYLKPRNDADLRIKYFGLRIGQEIGPGATLHLSLAQRDELAGLFSERAAITSAQQGWGVEWNGASHAVLDGVKTREGVLKYVDRANAADDNK